MTSDPHQLRPDHLPTPFTADEIRAGCQPGRMVRSLVVQPNTDPIVHVTRFVSADARGAEQDSWEETPDGARVGEAKRRRSTWLEFQEHASFPAATTERSEQTIEIPAGRFDCVRYTTSDGEGVQTFWFARSVPGMPLRFEERVGGELVYSSTAIENVPGGAKPPWFGLHLPSYTFPDSPPDKLFDRVAEQARAAEAARFSLVTVMDHLYQIQGVGPVTDPMLEGWSSLAALARETTSVRLGTLVSGVTYRNPALLAKMATTLDVVSGGRAMLGIGAAWNDEEHIGYGYDFPAVAERMDRLDEALTIIRAMFTEDRPTFVGRHYRIDEVLNVPRPIQPGGPRILVGGGGEKRTLKIAARHADLTHWFPLGLDVLRHKAEILEGYCEEIGRDPSTIERTMAAPVVVAGSEAEARSFLERMPAERRPYVKVGTPEQMAEALQPYLDAGFTGFTFNNSIYRTPEQIAQVGELLKLVAGSKETRSA
ncbi:MAG: LLM class F420-dependent oxidoreductase [Chloroflexota bacterium]|nr:LLM class F420-dependent oxidoreductase [Chloroflexota bacterium]